MFEITVTSRCPGAFTCEKFPNFCIVVLQAPKNCPWKRYFGLVCLLPAYNSNGTFSGDGNHFKGLSTSQGCAFWTLTFDLLTLNSSRTWRVTWPTLPPSLKTLPLFVHELRVMKCERGHCACAGSRDSYVGGQKQLHIWNPRPGFAYWLYNFYWATTTNKGRLLSSVTNAKALVLRKLLVRDPVTLTFHLLT